MPGIAESNLAGVCTHSVLYGIYLMLFAGCIYVLLFRNRWSAVKRSRKMNKTLLAVTLVLFVLVTAHWILQVLRVFRVFIYRISYDHYNPYYPPMYIASTGLSVTGVTVADMTMIYRLYLVWGRSWRVVIVPSTTTVVAIVASIRFVERMTRGRDYDIYSKATKPWVMSLVAADMVTNIYVTAFIAYRIWSIRRAVRSSNPSALPPIVAIIVESAGIYTAFLVFVLITFLTDSNLTGTALELISPGIGIAFSLIIVRVGLGMGAEERKPPSNPGRSQRSRSPTSYPLEFLSSNTLQSTRHGNDLEDLESPTTRKHDVERGIMSDIEPI